ncbi:MAG: RidA family protein [Solirubrobacterales bacterium]|nr:RidA family protein [Solirubrobacterales bacterium]
MAITPVTTPKLAMPGAQMSQALRVDAAGPLLFISGLTARGPDGQTVGAGDVGRQTEVILEAIESLVDEAGGVLADVVKLTVFVRDVERFREVAAVRSRYFSEPYPASSMVEVSRLVSPDQLVEIEAIAAIGQAAQEVEE